MSNETNTTTNLLEIGDVIAPSGMGNWELTVIRFDYCKFYEELEIVLTDLEGYEVQYLESNFMGSIANGQYVVNPSWAWANDA